MRQFVLVRGRSWSNHEVHDHFYEYWPRDTGIMGDWARNEGFRQTERFMKDFYDE